MKKYFNSKVILLAIVVIAAVLRFYQIDSNPPGLNWDEAAWGYNSYSLGIDGRDEFGKFLPTSFIESYGDYKPPVYAYLGIVPVKIFGLNEFGVRFPSAFLGVITVLLTYFLVKEIFYRKKDERGEMTALLASFILAVSPWHIMLSRAAFEANVSTFFIVLGILLFLRAVNRNMWFLIGSAASFGLSFYAFNTARIFAPLIILSMAAMFRKALLENKKQVLLSVLAGLIFLGPLVPFLLSPQAKLRYQEVNIFSDVNVVKMSNREIANDNGAVWSKVIHNRRILYGLDFLEHYSDNLNPSFLFIKGDGNPRFSTQDVGELYLIDLPFLLIGLYVLFKKREGHFWIIPLWLILGIIPAATARETPHALRIETVIPTLQILVALGIVEFIYLFKKYRNLMLGIVLVLIGVNFLYFFHGLTTHYAREYSSEWQYSYKDAVSYVSSVEKNYKNITVTNELGRPYIYFLFYTKYNPRLFRKEANVRREIYGFVHIDSFGKYKFQDSIDTSSLKRNNLYLDIPKNVPSDVEVLKTFYLLDGSASLVAYETNR